MSGWDDDYDPDAADMPADPTTPMSESAVAMREVYLSYVEAGFTADQALYLTGCVASTLASAEMLQQSEAIKQAMLARVMDQADQLRAIRAMREPRPRATGSGTMTSLTVVCPKCSRHFTWMIDDYTVPYRRDPGERVAAMQRMLGEECPVHEHRTPAHFMDAMTPKCIVCGRTDLVATSYGLECPEHRTPSGPPRSTPW